MMYKAPPASWRQWLALLSTLIALILFTPSGATATARLKTQQAATAEVTGSSTESEHAAVAVDTKRGLNTDQPQQQQQASIV
ncbi:hypothetical protein BG015_003754, partial [Linnemannia schmuckeri]